MFRLPTHLESLVPPPRDQVPQSQPWRGAILLPASSPHPAARPREIAVTAAEIENDNQQETWPRHFQIQIIRQRGILREVQAWLAQVQLGGHLARCMLMPDRLQERAASRENHAIFESFAHQLLEEGMVAIAPWSVTDPTSSGGILLYPTTTTRALLVGVVFLGSGFPEFIQGSTSHSPIAGPSRGQQNINLFPRNNSQGFQPSLFDPPPPNISSSSRGYPTAGYSDPSRTRSGRSSG
ncbi:hypothetical protein C8Q74DRAFT_195908 [Fomes fomentarius]|nr:hypothetical protein C8Q74DRAFT_195908 [Fomes fomentarius]